MFFLIILGCATAYHPKNLLGGYEDREVSPNIFEVKFTGNQHTRVDKIRYFLLFRCAELTLENNFSNFIILSDNSYSKESIINSEVSQPFTSRVSLSGGHITVVTPEFGVQTTSNEFTGIFLITLFNENDPPLQTKNDSGYAAKKIIDDLKYVIE